MKPKITAFLTALVSPYQELELAFRQLRDERGLGTAVGKQLEDIGKLVGQEREGLDDATYERYIRARIKTNRSSGLTEELIEITDLILFDDAAYINVMHHYVATVVISIEDIELTEDLVTTLIGFLRTAKAAGVRLILRWRESPLVDTFRFDSGPQAFDRGHLAGAVT